MPIGRGGLTIPIKRFDTADREKRRSRSERDFVEHLSRLNTGLEGGRFSAKVAGRGGGPAPALRKDRPLLCQGALLERLFISWIF